MSVSRRDDMDDALEAWETPESRMRREAWRGSPAIGPLPRRSGGRSQHVPGSSADMSALALQLTQSLALASLVSELASLRREVRDLRQLKSPATPATPASFENVKQTLNRAQFAATLASRQALAGRTVAISVERAEAADALSEFVVFVTVDAPAETQMAIEVEQAFYGRLQEVLPDDLIPTVDVMLRFVAPE